MKISLLVAAISLSWATTGIAQKTLRVAHGCAYKSAMEGTDLYTFDPSEEADRIVSEICNAMGVSQNFGVRSANVENALATNDGTRRIILYSTVFLKKFNEDARTRWAAYSVLAHEIGHHFNGHNFGEPDSGKRKKMELEADRFSGSALRLLGATLDESKAGIETFALQGEQAKHPSAKARTEALASGWNQMQERLEKMGGGTPTPTPDSNIPRDRDTDGDGIPDKNDACPEAYGRTLTAGCPDADEDGIPDSEDKCRYLKGPAQWKGCPDSDGDGIPDHEDRCPKEPGYLTDGGCPPPDRDGDRVTDRADKCPDVAGLARFQGCPDNDGDGVPDPEDKCPREKGEPLYDGCVQPSTKNVEGLPKDLQGVELVRIGERPNTEQGKVPSDMVLIRGGTFTMGDQFSEGDSDEKPTHSVTLSDFYMGKYEVTFDEYDAFCVATGREKPADEGWGRGRRPVINVDWYDAVEYCNWRSQRENLGVVYSIDKNRKDPNNQNKIELKKWIVVANFGAKGYRLPTEAEWEYAAREEGRKVRFGNGRDTIDPSEINVNPRINSKKNYSITGLYRGKTVPVDDLSSNSLGLKHMSGNVWEWCGDWYDEKYYRNSRNAQNPLGPSSGKLRVLRGGSWFDNPEHGRVALRNGYVSDFSLSRFGFRVVRSY